MSNKHNRPCVHPEPCNQAVHRCCQARNRALADSKGLKLMSYETANLGAEAYLAAMPDISTISGIRDYAACINHAVAINVLTSTQAPSMLASARIVLESLRMEEKSHNAAVQARLTESRIDLNKAALDHQKSKRLQHQPPANQTAA